MNLSQKVLVLFGISLLIFACSLPGFTGIFPINEVSNPNTLPKYILAGSDATATPTPFQPFPPTPTYIPTAYPTLPSTPTPEQFGSREDSIDDANPAGGIPGADEYTHILLLGSDQRPYSGGFRTDTIILMSLNPKTGTAALISFPRDLYIYIPGWKYQRINTAHAHGGFQLLADTLAYNFGIRPEHYVMVNFWGFVQVIDSLGGIDVKVAKSLTDHRDGYGYYTVSAGTVHMDGDTALWYVRSRYTSSDFDRNRRQQEVLQAIFERLLNLDVIARAPEIFDIYAQNVTTDLTISDITPLLPLATRLSDTSRIRHYYVGSGYVTSWVTPGGAQVLLPKTEAIIGLLWEAFGNP
jgi:LCP family protein required for cell wall assembly